MEWWFISTIHIVLLSLCSSIPQCQHYLNRRRGGVFHYDRHMRYQLNYRNAQEACVQDFGGKIATRDQLEKALNVGLEECRAGWITSAEVAYPRITKHWNCGENKTGIISYGIRQNLQEKWDVFCYKEDDDCSLYDRAFFQVFWGTTASPSRNMFRTAVPVTHELTSKTPPTISTLLSSSTVPSREGINSRLPKEKNRSHTKKINYSEDQENNFESHFPSVNFSEHNEPLKEQEVRFFDTTVELNSTSNKYKDSQNRIDKTTLVTNSTYVPASAHDTQTKPYLPTSGNRLHDGMSTKTSLNISVTRLDVVNSILHEKGSNDSSYEMMVRRENFDVLPQSSMIATTENPDFYNTTFLSRSNFITGESTTTDINYSITTISEVKNFFPERHQRKMDLHSADFLSTSQDEGTTQENMFHISTSQSHNQIVQTVSDNILTGGEQEQPIATTRLALSYPLISPSNSPYEEGDLINKDQQNVYNDQKPGNEIIIHKTSNSSDKLTEQFMPTENQTDVLHMTTDQINTQHKTLLDIYPTTSSHLHYQEKEVQAFEDLEKNASSEPTLTSNLENDTNINVNRDTTRGTPGNRKAVDKILTPSAMTAMVDSTTHSEKITPKTSSFFTPYDHMKGTASPTNQSNVTDLNLDSCGGWLKALSGQFHSPGFPQSYEKDMNCIWVIEVPLGYYVILDFVSLVIEEHRNCEYDYVMVYDGMESDQRVLGRFCGSQLPSKIRGSSNTITVIMRSDSSVELDGISLQFRATQTSSGVSLTEGKNSLEGVVEINYQGVRGNICAKQWNNNDAQVVCQQLGFSGPAIATRIIGNGNVSWAISFVSCNGRESSLEKCSVKNTGVCGTGERAGVICQVYESCANLKNAGVQESGNYIIDPDGVGQGESHFPVECDMETDITTGITIVGHNAEGKERVIPCQTPGCYSRVITYKAASLDQLRTLTSISENCEQFVKLDCRHVRFLDGQWGWWVSRDGEQIISWGGANTNGGRCSCGEKGECANGITSCNCDANDDMWRMDEGAITDKSSLPIQEFRFGGTSDVPMAMAFHRIGKLRCWGTISEPPVLESCAALKEAGITDSGRYLIDPDGVNKGVPQFEVFCDMSSHAGITVIGHNSERRTAVSPCEEAGCYKRETDLFCRPLTAQCSD
ncbi:uncharacterized protein LOC121001914 [Bufo bufo]|uniref:uncharacterized protein LOC121001914 n=1 Tax=Bufo bufo TaxID=8384 RepID=UPI001ABDB4D2|nr:uncharacterized protein LOC121001914 [Bufo bufo]XP_040289087.1 uncharacterized protein LOC121001914 [Bufo bufo]